MLHLDLRDPQARVRRAKEQVDLIARQVHRISTEEPLFASSMAQVAGDPQWWVFQVEPRSITNEPLGLVFGEALYNLRCALDHIVAALVLASGATVTSKHQFPAEWSEVRYLKSVGDRQATRPRGCLQGVTVGLELVWELQPFNQTPEPRADPLWQLTRFSNADKHRHTAVPLIVPNCQNITYTHNGGGILEQHDERIRPSGATAEIAGKRILSAVRFEPPIPTLVNVDFKSATLVGFMTAPIGNEVGSFIGYRRAAELCAHVEMIVNLFGQL